VPKYRDLVTMLLMSMVSSINSALSSKWTLQILTTLTHWLTQDRVVCDGARDALLGVVFGPGRLAKETGFYRKI